MIGLLINIFFVFSNREAYGTNVLSPLLEIANGFISKVHRLHFEVQLLSEHPQTPLYSANRTVSLSTVISRSSFLPGPFPDLPAIRLDHVIILVNKRSGHTKKRELKLKIPLVGIEAKVSLRMIFTYGKNTKETGCSVMI
jgi:hypothetical protein